MTNLVTRFLFSLQINWIRRVWMGQR